MNEANKERILDAYLEEVLGGNYPPDLTAKILQTWNARQEAAEAFVESAAAVTPREAGDFSMAYEPAPPPVQYAATPAAEYSAATVERAPRPSSRRHSRAPRWWLALATGVLAAGVTLLIYVVRQDDSADHSFAKVNKQGPSTPAINSNLKGSGRPAVPGSSPIASDYQPQPPVVRKAPPQRPSHPAPPRLVKREPVKTPVVPRQVKPPAPDQDIIAFINDVLKQAWREHGVTPSPPLADQPWCQRVYQRLIGREPSKGELDRFVKSKAADKRQQLIDQLLASEDYAHYWSAVWAKTLLGSAAKAELAGLTAFLFESLQANTPYDQLASKLLTATGTNQPGGASQNGAVNFLMSGAENHALEATDRTARVFLGRQVTCTRCHAHPANSWDQSEFWELNAFFRQMRVLPEPGTRFGHLTDADFLGESGAAKDAEIFYKSPDGRLRIAYPALNGQELPHSGLLGDVHRRQELASRLVATEDFSRAAVNRLWANLLGYGFVQPVDDLGPHNPPAHPQLLERLSDELAAHKFDLKSLTRWIALSEPFGLSSRRMPESSLDAPEKGGEPLFARGYSPGEDNHDVYKAVLLVANARKWRSLVGNAAPGKLTRIQQLRTDNLEIIEDQSATLAAGKSWLSRLAGSSMRPEQKVEHLFLSALGRPPTAREMTAAKLLLADRLNDAVAVPELWRTLLSTCAATGP